MKNKLNPTERDWKMKMDQLAEEVPENLWERIQEKREEKKSFRKLPWIYPAIGVAASLLIIFNFFTQEDHTQLSLVADHPSIQKVKEPLPNPSRDSFELNKPKTNLALEKKSYKKSIVKQASKPTESPLEPKEESVVHEKTFYIQPEEPQSDIKLAKNTELEPQSEGDSKDLQIVKVSLEEKNADDVIIIQLSSSENQKAGRKKMVRSILSNLGEILDGNYTMEKEKLKELKSKKSL